MEMLEEERFLKLYEELLKPVFSEVKNHTLTVVPHLVGNLYNATPIRLMVVGRAVNGWDDVDFHQCGKALDAAQLVMQMHNVNKFSRIVDRGSGEKDWYLFSRSAFWRLIHNSLVGMGEATEGIWYDDPLKWQEKVLWSNLYKIAPRMGGNPDEELQKLIYKKCVEILKEEISVYKPTHILFVTGDDWFFYNKWEGYFAESLGIKKIPAKERNNKYILGTGSYHDAKVVVCVRPEMKPDADICQAVLQGFSSIE